MTLPNFVDFWRSNRLTAFGTSRMSSLLASLRNAICTVILPVSPGLDIHHWDEPLLPSLCLAMRSLTLRLSKGQVAFTLIHRSMQAL